MDSKDIDMMDSDPPPPSTTTTTAAAELSDQIEVARRLLTLARQLLDQGKPSQALQAVLTAMRAKGGEAAALQALTRAKELYRNKIHEINAADELASLFAECAIAEASPEPSTSNNAISSHPPFPSFEPDGSGTSILAETGRKQVVLDAFSDEVASSVCNAAGLLATTVGTSTTRSGAVDCRCVNGFMAFVVMKNGNVMCFDSVIEI